jgi:hypothetical protein
MPVRIRLAIVGLAIVAAACGPAVHSPSATSSAVATPPPTAAPLATTTPTPSPAFPRNPAPIVEGAAYEQSINPADFVAGIDNPFFPLTPGTRFTFGGDEDNIVTVLSDTKLILGVTTTVVHDEVYVDGALEEDTLDYYAQDRDGNVWYFGEKTSELKNGKVTSTAGSWEGGVDGGQPGIVMLAAPQVGDSYRQEFLKGEAEDLAKVTAVAGSITAPVGSWTGADVLVTEEWTPLEPDIREQKTYARGVGIVETRVLKGGKEMVRLRKVEHGVTAMASGTGVLAGFVGLFGLPVTAVRARRGRSRAAIRRCTLSTLAHTTEARGLRCRGSFEGRCCRRAGPATRSR